MTFNELYQSLQPEARGVLDKVWAYWEENHTNIPVNVLLHTLDRPDAPEFIANIGGDKLDKIWGGQAPCYQISLLGALLTTNGPAYGELLSKYLTVLQQKYEEDPEVRAVSPDDLSASPGFTEESQSTLADLLHLPGSHLFGVSSGEPPHWNILAPTDLYHLRFVDDFVTYIQSELMKDRDRAQAIPKAEVQAALSQFYSPEAISADLRIGGSRDASSGEMAFGINDVEFPFIKNADLRTQLDADRAELLIVYGQSAWKSAIFLCGRILEGMLLGTLLQRCEQAKDAAQKLKIRNRSEDLDRWDLGELVKVAEALSLIKGMTRDLSELVKSFRNLVHPGLELREGVEVTAEVAGISLNVVKIYARQLATLD